ncbi:hypothetical protein GCM10009738_21970 [Kitasatospora viridis]
MVNEPSGFATVNDVSVVNASTVTGLPVFFACATAACVGVTGAAAALLPVPAGDDGAASAGKLAPARTEVSAATSASRRRRTWRAAPFLRPGLATWGILFVVGPGKGEGMSLDNLFAIDLGNVRFAADRAALPRV